MKLFIIIFILVLSLVNLNDCIFAQIVPADVTGKIEQDITPNDTIVYLDIPTRPENAMEGAEFTDKITGLSLRDREIAIVEEILAGNVPSFSRKLRPLKISHTIGSDHYQLIFFSVCDYMAVGSDQDYLYVPMTPSTAQYLADKLDCTLPTKKMVDIIYAGAGIKLYPQPIPPSNEMTTVPVFSQHTDSIKQQIFNIGYDRSADSIIAGHKKDIIISNKIYSTDRSYERVVIYGWHLSENNPIQPVYNGHSALYADYSHGVRLISNVAFINGDSSNVRDILQDGELSVLLSSEGIISKPYYPPSDFFTSMGSRLNNSLMDFELYQNYPNPFNPSTTIKFQIPNSEFTSLKVYNILGEEVATLVSDNLIKGNRTYQFDGKNLTSGIYYYQLVAGDYREVKKMILLK